MVLERSVEGGEGCHTYIYWLVVWWQVARIRSLRRIYTTRQQKFSLVFIAYSLTFFFICFTFESAFACCTLSLETKPQKTPSANFQHSMMHMNWIFTMHFFKAAFLLLVSYIFQFLLKYCSSFLTNTGLSYVTVSIWKWIRKQNFQYTSTNHYLHYIFTNTGIKII